jgi:hypothetical protein
LSGERYDVVINADQTLSSYWIQVRGYHQCKNLHQEAMLVYDGATLPHEFDEAAISSLEVSKPHTLCPQFL